MLRKKSLTYVEYICGKKKFLSILFRSDTVDQLLQSEAVFFELFEIDGAFDNSTKKRAGCTRDGGDDRKQRRKA